MKRLLFPCLALSVSFALLPHASAQDPSEEFNPLGRDLIDILDKQMRVHVEWIEVSHETYTRLMSEGAGREGIEPFLSSDDSPLRQTLAELAKEGEARVLDTAMLIVRSGQRGKVESIHEYIYPTEFDPAEAFVLEKDAPPGTAPILGNHLPTPTAFETRNVGTTLEVDPVLGADERTVDLNLAPEIVYLPGHSEWGDYRSRDGELTVKMPSFYTMKVTTQVTLRAGQHCLIAAVSPHHAETGMPERERKVMVFVKADVLVVGLPPEEEAADPE